MTFKFKKKHTSAFGPKIDNKIGKKIKLLTSDVETITITALNNCFCIKLKSEVIQKTVDRNNATSPFIIVSEFSSKLNVIRRSLFPIEQMNP